MSRFSMAARALMSSSTRDDILEADLIGSKDSKGESLFTRPMVRKVVRTLKPHAVCHEHHKYRSTPTDNTQRIASGRISFYDAKHMTQTGWKPHDADTRLCNMALRGANVALRGWPIVNFGWNDEKFHIRCTVGGGHTTGGTAGPPSMQAEVSAKMRAVQQRSSPT